MCPIIKKHDHKTFCSCKQTLAKRWCCRCQYFPASRLIKINLMYINLVHRPKNNITDILTAIHFCCKEGNNDINFIRWIFVEGIWYNTKNVQWSSWANWMTLYSLHENTVVMSYSCCLFCEDFVFDPFIIRMNCMLVSIHLIN